MAVPHPGRQILETFVQKLEAMANTSFWPPCLGIEARKVRARKKQYVYNSPIFISTYESIYVYKQSYKTHVCMVWYTPMPFWPTRGQCGVPRLLHKGKVGSFRINYLRFEVYDVGLLLWCLMSVQKAPQDCWRMYIFGVKFGGHEFSKSLQWHYALSRQSQAQP